MEKNDQRFVDFHGGYGDDLMVDLDRHLLLSSSSLSLMFQLDLASSHFLVMLLMITKTNTVVVVVVVRFHRHDDVNDDDDDDGDVCDVVLLLTSMSLTLSKLNRLLITMAYLIQFDSYNVSISLQG